MLKKNKKSQKKIVPLPFPVYTWSFVAILCIGLFDSIYLSISHYRVYVDIGYSSFCAISKALNCDTVSQSPYSIFFDVPVPIWGIWAYAVVLFLLYYAWHVKAEKKRVWTLLMLVSLAFSIYSVILAFISSYHIHSYCIMCILSYAVNLALLFYTWIIRKRFECESFFTALWLDIRYLLGFWKTTMPVFSGFGIVAVAMIIVFPPYWLMDPPKLNGNIPTGITVDGHPWIGAGSPELEIIEFSDYRCFQCKKMHYFLRRLIEAHPDRIRLVHRQFPMDHTINPLVKESFHPGAAKLAILAIYAGKYNKFWEMNDYLFGLSRDIEALNMKTIAKDVGLEFESMHAAFKDQRIWNELWQDIKEGIRDYELSGTPGFVIDGQMHLAQIPPEIFKPYL